ncbi:flagellar hook protein FlgE [Dyella acidisoli]|uniref:Flagellar hook protein FlgE n=1 Tax=Dyella acidisoli TaxID=1867834 RepID=A0ABQ5XLV2_9GAMM|nr:flagellar hook-basal body complex protein [Dyella acidisoli]GLQ92647.1 flagellar hook protein FlgE [Dyella acidisoli]
MLESIYIGMSGLTAYSKGLQTISNNVANMNTPGFKATTPRFADLFYGQEFAPGQAGTTSTTYFGTGVEYGYASIDFSQGEIRQSDGDLDLAIQGNGFLTLLDGQKAQYARTGQFVVGDDGYLVDKVTGLRLAMLNSAGKPEAISLTDKTINPPVATTLVQFSDNLSSSATDFSIPNVVVYDGNGDQHTLTINFKPDNKIFPGRWAVTVTDENGSVVQQSALQFLGGIPEPGMDRIDVTMTPTGGAPFTFTLDFSSGVTGFSSGSVSTLKVASVDGYGAGILSSLYVDADGVLNVGYSNGQKLELGSVALASFTDTQLLTQQGNGLFDASRASAPQYTTSRGPGVGQLISGAVEASNVDLSTEFGRLILIQRGFQASSQVISTANEMIMQLFQMRGQQG